MDKPIRGAHEVQALRAQKLQEQLSKLSNRVVQQIATQEDFEQWCESGFNPIAQQKKFRSVEEQHKTHKKEKLPSESKEDELIQDAAKLEETANRFHKKNDELALKTLILLRNSILATDTADEILAKVLQFYPDPTLADEALNFLLETTYGDLAIQVGLAKEKLFATYEREIVAGRNMSHEAKEFSKQGLGSPSALRDIYRDITGNPRVPQVLFEEFAQKFPFEQMKIVIAFLLHSLGADLKAKGPSIPRAQLQRLLEDTRTLQAILGVYRFFGSRMQLIASEFVRNGLVFPKVLSFELLSKQFMKLLYDRYVSSERVLNLARSLGLSEQILAQIIIYTQMRDAIRQVSPRLYKSEEQREELLKAIIEALEELEEEEEELEEEEEEE